MGSVDCPFLHDLRLDMLNAKRVPLRITPNLTEEMLPVNIKLRKPPAERIVPADGAKYINKTNQGSKRQVKYIKSSH